MRLGRALGVVGALLSACSGSNDGGPGIVTFASAECHGALVEIARFSQVQHVVPISAAGAFNSLAIDGDTLFMTYAFASSASGLSPSGGIVAIPVTGGPAHVVAAAENTSQWGTDSFWVDSGQIHVQTGTEILSFPEAPSTPSTLPVILAPGLYGAYAHDAQFGYSAQARATDGGVTIAKTSIAGGAPTVLVDERLPNGALGGMADAGDAVLLQVRWHPDPTSTGDTSTSIWRIPKDGTPRTDARPDVAWADSLVSPHWLAWDGENIFGPITVQHYIMQARVPAAGTSAPVHLKLQGTVATRRGDEILSLQTLGTQDGQGSTSRILVASTEGAPAGSVVACGEEASVLLVRPTGIAANDSAIYVAYQIENSGADDGVVIARVSP